MLTLLYLIELEDGKSSIILGHVHIPVDIYHNEHVPPVSNI